MPCGAGCTAVDMVMNIGALKSGHHAAVAEELRAFKDAAGGAVTKCILEVCYLTDQELVTGSQLVAEAGIDFVKTSSGSSKVPAWNSSCGCATPCAARRCG
jgi:deoxyribose-phosphate aldolase